MGMGTLDTGAHWTPWMDRPPPPLTLAPSVPVTSADARRLSDLERYTWRGTRAVTRLAVRSGESGKAIELSKNHLAPLGRIGVCRDQSRGDAVHSELWSVDARLGSLHESSGETLDGYPVFRGPQVRLVPRDGLRDGDGLDRRRPWVALTLRRRAEARRSSSDLAHEMTHGRRPIQRERKGGSRSSAGTSTRPTPSPQSRFTVTAIPLGSAVQCLSDFAQPPDEV